MQCGTLGLRDDGLVDGFTLPSPAAGSPPSPRDLLDGACARRDLGTKSFRLASQVQTLDPKSGRERGQASAPRIAGCVEERFASRFRRCGQAQLDVDVGGR